MTRDTYSRQRAERKGRWAELRASLLLTLKGYQIIERRYKSPLGEIDIIAKRGDLLAFVEVKARQSRESAINAVSHTAQRRICAAAGMFFSRRPDLATFDVRYDIIAVTGWRMFHLRDMWRDRA